MKRRLALHWWILIGMVAGVVCGVIVARVDAALVDRFLATHPGADAMAQDAERVTTRFVHDWVSPFGDLFMRLLRMIAVPLVLFSLVAGVASLNDTAKVGRIGGKTIALYLATTAIAITIGLVVVNVVDPAGGISEALRAKMRAGATAAKITEQLKDADQVANTSVLRQLFEGIVPTNPFSSLSSGAMLQVVFFALMLGIALTRLETRAAAHVIKVFQLLSDAIIEMVLIIMRIAPFGVFALIATVTANLGKDMGELQEILGALALYMVCVVFGLVLHVALVYVPILKFVARMPLARFFRGMAPAQLLAFSSSSSGATLPVTMRCAEKNIGVDEEVSGFVLPLGATINMDGTGLYQGIAAVFIAGFYRPDGLTLGDQLQIVLTATLASIGTAAVPGVGVIMLIVVLRQIGVPAEGILLILGVDRPLDMCRTVVNITGDVVVASAVAASEGLLHDPDASEGAAPPVDEEARDR